MGLGLDDAEPETLVVFARRLVLYNARATLVFAAVGLHLVCGSEDKVTTTTDAVEMVGILGELAAFILAVL